eukprot:562263_1
MSFAAHDFSICKYHNPYFGTDCDKGIKGSKCQFRHLPSAQFIRYCTKINKGYPFSTADREMSNIARTLLHDGKASQAIKKYNQLIKIHPVCANIEYRIGLCHEHMHNLDYAGVHYRRAISINPNISSFHRDYANYLYTTTKNIEHSQYHFEEALRLLRDDADASAIKRVITHQQYASFLSNELHNYDKAQLHYEQALERCDECLNCYAPRYALCIDVHEGYATTLDCNHGDPHKIHYHFRAALALSTQIPGHKPFHTHYLYAVYLKKIGDTERSKYHFEASTAHKVSTPQIRDESDNDREVDFATRAFNRFITEKVIAGAIGAKYVKQFETLQVNDLRYFEFIDAGYLETQIGMNALHILLCIKQMDKFKRKCKEFDEWLKSIDVYYEYSSLLASFGILTFESFYKYINTIDDILHVIGTWNRDDAKYIFENTPKR